MTQYLLRIGMGVSSFTLHKAEKMTGPDVTEYPGALFMNESIG
jgi:hypothetical protein